MRCWQLTMINESKLRCQWRHTHQIYRRGSSDNKSLPLFGQSQLQNVLDSLYFQKVIFLFTFEYWKAKLYVSNPSFYVIGLAFYASVDI